MRGIIVVILLIVSTVFIVENTQVVSLHFLNNTFAMPRALLLALTLGLGIIIGMLIAYRKK